MSIKLILTSKPELPVTRAYAISTFKTTEAKVFVATKFFLSEGLVKNSKQ
jgi:hypothetical protein